MNGVDAQIERVFRYIWNYVTECEELPKACQIAAVLYVPQEDVQHCIRLLRAQQRLCLTTR